nr:toprim domain-containing protein [uncultured Allomuricauda sp.]
MNCEQANKIPLETVLKSMGYKALGKHSGGSEQWFENPLRTERTPSFSVNHQKNVWQDLGTDKGGSVIDLVMEYGNTSVSGALTWLSDHIGGSSLPQIERTHSTGEYEQKKPRYEVRKSGVIMNPALMSYVEQRGISQKVARKHLKEVRYFDTETEKEFFGLGMQNVSGGWSIRNKYMKTVIAPNGFANVRGNGEAANTVNVFEGMFDYLSYLMMTEQTDARMRCIVLNSTKMAKQAADFLRKDITVQNVVLWLDNEPEGSKASEAVEQATAHFTALPFAVYDARDTFYGFEDLNASWVATKEMHRIEMRPIKYHDHDQNDNLQMEL